MKNLLTLSLAFVLISLMIIGCSSTPSGPEDVAKEFISRIEKGDNSALDLMAPELIEMLGKEKMEKGIQESSEKIKKNGGVKSVEISDKEIKDNEATMNVKTNYGNGTSETEKMKLVNKDGKWLITIAK